MGIIHASGDINNQIAGVTFIDSSPKRHVAVDDIAATRHGIEKRYV